MKTLPIYIILSLLFLGFNRGSAQVPTTTRNYIVETTVKVEGKQTPESLLGLPVESVNKTVKYLDGMGRPTQVIVWQGSPSKRDLVTPVVYDNLGREDKSYLPYSATLAGSDGGYKASALTDQNLFYTTPGTATTGWLAPGVTAMPNNTAHAKTVFEAGPLNRVLEQGAPGAAWQPVPNSTTGHTQKMEYGTNAANEVKYWRVNATDNGAAAVSYQTDRLFKTVIRDENWKVADGKGGTRETFKDVDGRVVLERVWESNVKSLSTYYVYDDLGNLRYILPPAVNEDGQAVLSSFTESVAAFENFIYAYRYDGRRNLIQKKVPGKGWEYMVYNKADQMILSQDAAQRIRKEWSYARYDKLGRAVSIGLYTNTAQTTLAQIRTLVDNFAGPLWEDRKGAASYANTTFPVAGTGVTVKPLSVSYYDNYSFTGASTLPVQNVTHSLLTQGLSTGNIIYKDDGTAPLLTVSYYDDKGRVIQQASQNHLGGTDYLTNTYSYIGEVMTSRHDHKASPSGAVTSILTAYTYDHMGRLVDTKKTVNTQSEIIQSHLVYNEIGQLRHKKLHSVDNGTNFITQVDYSYNERSWITKIGSPHFTEVLRYNDPTATAVAQYNGNISEQHWGHGTTATPNRFVYAYDKLDRLLSGISTGITMSEVLTYDNMGNILTLKRNNAATTSYAYTGNRLTGLSGGITGSYTYDVNGNATTDRTGMAFTYNQLDLPKTATKTGTSVVYMYNATGSMQRKTTTVGGTATQRDYVSGIEYNKLGSAASKIEMIHTEDGYLQRDESNNIYLYRYNLTDHLGNVRATLQPSGAASATVIQKDDYFPFGKRKGILTSGINKYLYNGKERLDELAGGSHTFGSSYTLEGQYDYGARFYDAEVGRWNVVDPLADKYHSFSPYVYAMNDPIYYIDPDGRQTASLDWGATYTGMAAQNFLQGYLMQYFPGEDMYYTRLPEVKVAAYRLTDDMIWDIAEASYKAFWAGTGFTRYVAPSHRHLFGPNPYRPSAGPQTAEEWERTGDIVGSSEIPGLAQVGDLISLGSNIYQGNGVGITLSLAAFVPGGSQAKLAAKMKFVKDFATKNTKNYSAYFKSEREARNLAKTKLGKNPVEIETNKWRSSDGKWQYRAKPGDVDDKHIHIEELNPKTGEVLQNYHLRWE
ncbi:DUF6443 domain-containing protein [Sphingobacterium olei]|nr:DUF6443 domain-containing protein [Sphingobacterium olei]